MAYVNRDNPNCTNCNKSGLAILPVRYAVVPKIADAELPARLGNKVTNTVLKHHKYALRTLRQGYLYLYYEKHARGRHIKWEVYSVANGSTLWKQISTLSVEPVVEAQCSRKEHILPASVITIDTPEKCGRVWMAFSEHIWSQGTYDLFEKDVALRDRRMQTFAPALWIKQHDYRHGMEATEANLNQVIEYKTGFALSALGGTDLGTLSKPDGSYDSKRLQHCSTMHQITVRREDKAKLVEIMQKAGENGKGANHTPAIIALWDSVGMTHELNGFRNDALGWVKKFNEEREFEIEAAAAIEGAKVALDKRAATATRAYFDTAAFKWGSDDTRKWMQNFDRTHGADLARRDREMDLCERWERDAAKRVPFYVSQQRAKYTGLADPAWQARMAEIDMAAGPQTETANKEARAKMYRHDGSASHIEKNAFAHSWDTYEPRIDRAALNQFLQNRKSLCVAADALAEDRTEDVVAWLKSSALQNALLEFHDSSVHDGMVFTQTVANLIFGIESSEAGRILIRSWVDSGRVAQHNLVWRCFSLNQQEGNADLDVILALMASNKEKPASERALQQIKDATKHIAKLGALAQKGLALHNALRTDGVARIPTGGIEKLLVSVGNLILQPFVKKVVDTLSEGLVSALLLARVGSDHIKIMNLLVDQARAGPSERAGLMIAFTSGIAMITDRFKARQGVWTELARDADIPKPNADPQQAGKFNESKQLAFGMVATILQTVYVWKLYSDAERLPDNEKIRAELWIAGFSLGAGLADLFATGLKSISSQAEKALTFQALKLGGGILSAASSWNTLLEDLNRSDLSMRKGDETISYLYLTKGMFGAVSGACSFLSSISYAEPAFQLIASKFPETIIGRASAFVPELAESLAKRLLITRALLIAGGLYFSLAVIAIQLLIWKYSDNALQGWCARCAFGVLKTQRYGSAKTQMSEFKNISKEK